MNWIAHLFISQLHSTMEFKAAYIGLPSGLPRKTSWSAADLIYSAVVEHIKSQVHFLTSPDWAGKGCCLKPPYRCCGSAILMDNGLTQYTSYYNSCVKKGSIVLFFANYRWGGGRRERLRESYPWYRHIWGEIWTIPVGSSFSYLFSWVTRLNEIPFNLLSHTGLNATAEVH